MKRLIFLILFFPMVMHGQEGNPFKLADHWCKFDPIYLESGTKFSILKEQVVVVYDKIDSFLNFDTYKFDTLFHIIVQYSDSNNAIKIIASGNKSITIEDDNMEKEDKITILIKTEYYSLNFIVLRNLKLETSYLEKIGLNEQEKRISDALNNSNLKKKKALVYVKELKFFI